MASDTDCKNVYREEILGAQQQPSCSSALRSRKRQALPSISRDLRFWGAERGLDGDRSRTAVARLSRAVKMFYSCGFSIS